MIVVAWNDKTGRVYPPSDSCHRSPANKRFKSVKRETFYNADRAIKFYMQKCHELHKFKEVLR